MVNKEVFIKELFSKSKTKEEIEGENLVQKILLAATKVVETDLINFNAFTIEDVELAQSFLFEVNDRNQSTSNLFINMLALDKVKDTLRGINSLYLPSSEDFF